MDTHLESMVEAQSIADVWGIFLQAIGEFGFTRAMYAFTRYRKSDPYDDFEDVLFLSNHEKAYLEAFLGEGLFRDAPMVRWAARNVGASSWRVVAEAYASGAMTESERRVIELNHRFGIVAGYSLSFKHLSVRAKGALGLVAAPGMSQDSVDSLWKMHGQHLANLSNLMHLKVTNLPRHEDQTLTHRQREALEWVADGKTTQDIAVLMGISTAMVEKHLRLAREALDVQTTAHAIAKASRLNQIFVISN